MKRESLSGLLDNYSQRLGWYERKVGNWMAPAVRSQDLVTVVMPAFNAEATITQAIESVLAQSYEHIELIVIDDGSCDGTPEILSNYGDSITVIRQQCRHVEGLGATRNRAAASGSGKWIAFIDADDVWHPDKIRLQLAAAVDTGADVVFSNARNIGSDRVREQAYSVDSRPHGDTFSLLVRDNFIFTSSVMLTRTAFVAVGGFTTRSDVVQDWDLWLRLSANGMKFVGLSEVLIDYRWTSGSVSKSHDSMRRRRLGALLHALQMSDAGQRLSPVSKHIARSNLEAVSAWFLAQDDPLKAVWWYFRAVAYWPFNVKALKGLAKSTLGLR